MALNTPPPMSSDPVDEGSHHAVIHQIIDLGHQDVPIYQSDGTQILHQIHIGFELPHELNGKDKRRQISKTYTLSVGGRSNLRKVIHAAEGRSLTDDEVSKYNLRALIGKNVTLGVEHYTNKQNAKRHKITSVTALTRGMAVLGLENPPVVYEVEGGEPPLSLPDWLRKVINESYERSGRELPSEGETQPDGDYDPPPKSAQPAETFDEFDGQDEGGDSDDASPSTSEDVKAEEKPKPKRKRKAS